MPSGKEGELSPPDSDYESEIEDSIEELGKDTDDPDMQMARKLGEEVGDDVSVIELETFDDPVAQNIDDGVVILNSNEAVLNDDGVIADLRDKLSALSLKFAEQETTRKSYNLARFLAVFSIASTIGTLATLIYNALRNAQLDRSLPPQIPADTAAKIRDLVKQWSDDTDPYYWTSLADYVELTGKQDKPLTLADQLLFMDYTIGLFPSQQAFLWASGNDIAGFVDRLVAEYQGKGNSTPAMYRLVATLTYHGDPLPRGVAAGLLRYALTRILVLLTTPVLGAGGSGDEGELSPPPSEEEQEEASDEDVDEFREENRYAQQNAHTADDISNVVNALTLVSTNTQGVDAATNSVVDVTSSGVINPSPSPRNDQLQDAAQKAADKTADASKEAKNNNTRRYLACIVGLIAVGSAAAVIMEYLIRQQRGQDTGDLPPIPDATKQQLKSLVMAWNAQPDTQYWNSLADYADAHASELTAADQILFCNYTIQLTQASGFFLWDTLKDKTDTVDVLVKAYNDGGSKVSVLYRAATKLTYKKQPIPRADTADLLRLALAWIFRVSFQPDDQLRAPDLEGSAHLRPRVHVPAVTEGHNRDVYARGLLQRLYPDLPPGAAAAVRHLTLPDGEPYELLDSAAVMATLPPAVRARLADQYGLLLARLNRVFPLADGERVRRSTLTALAKPVGDSPAGTVVLVRETNLATVRYLLPHLVVDAATGRPRMRALPGGLAAACRPEPPVKEQVGGAADVALQVAGSLVWGLPEPWGPVAAAGITLIEALFGGADKPDPFGAVVTRLEDFIKQQEINAQATAIKGFADWMVQEQGVLASTQGDNSGYITDALLPELRKMTAPGDESVYNAVYSLENYLDVPGAFDLLVLGVSVHLLGLKMIVQLDALLASTARKAGDMNTYNSNNQLWRSDYANFYAAVMGIQGNPGWVQRIGKHIADFESSRLSQITEPYRYDNRIYITGPDGVYVDNDLGWTYRDAAQGDGDMTHFVADTFVYSGCCNGTSTRVEHQSDVQAARDQHVAGVVTELDDQYGGHVQTVKAWQSAIDQWNEHLPPQRPTQGPSIDQTTWQYDSTPHGAYWVDGNQVAYAVAFVNSSGPSPIGVWSDPVTIKGHAGPKVVNLPDDPLGMSVSRQIWRRFDLAEGGSKMSLIGLTTTMSQHSFQDDAST
ncbi:hypothetical protein [Nonomuraea sp. NPDC050643]|uniref:hypothetical protein n=1 Tax=Nonomuraea sp. NPDC050643 TaxID=3155660 RepID=UPI0033D964FC